MRISVIVVVSALAQSACVKTCTSDADCLSAWVCREDGRCEKPTPVADGAPCNDDSHCIGGVCLFSARGNVCATACADVSVCSTERCAPMLDQRTAGTTLRFTCQPSSGDRFLGESCSTDSECRSGLCQNAHCTSPCGTCPEPFSCQPTTVTREMSSINVGVCTWWPAQPALELGEVETPATGVAALTFDLPASAGAFTIVLEDAADQIPVVSRLVSPMGEVVVGNPVDGGTRDLARCSSGRGQATVLVPGSDDPRARPVPGMWRMEIALFDPMNFPVTQRQIAGRLERVAVVIKKPVPGGRVDLTLHLAPETGYAPDGSFVPAMLERFDEVLRDKVGASLGQVQVLRLPADAGARVSTSLQANQLWAEHSQDTVGARPVNVLLVKELTFAGGVSGGVPGPPGVYRRPGTGVVVAPLASGPQTTAVLASHEVLHFLGLSHTSDEFRGPDLISDTPSCANPNGNGCPDERNIMFPFFPTREPLSITAGQRTVLEGSPWLWHQLHPRACNGVEAIGVPSKGFLTNTTFAPKASVAATCGGSGAQRAHLVRLDSNVTALDVRVAGTGFSPIASLRRGDCSSAEVLCATADAGVASLHVDNAAAGAWFVLVDAANDGGVYSLTVQTTR